MNKSQIYYVKWKTRQKRLHTIKSTLNSRNDRNIVIVRRSLDALGWRMAKENFNGALENFPGLWESIVGFYSVYTLVYTNMLYCMLKYHVC